MAVNTFVGEEVALAAADRLREVDRQIALLTQERGVLVGLVNQSEVLAGRFIGARAAAILAETGPLHYRSLLHEMHRRGIVVGGKKPEATLLTSLHHWPGVRTVPHSGVWEAA